MSKYPGHSSYPGQASYAKPAQSAPPAPSAPMSGPYGGPPPQAGPYGGAPPPQPQMMTGPYGPPQPGPYGAPQAGPHGPPLPSPYGGMPTPPPQYQMYGGPQAPAPSAPSPGAGPPQFGAQLYGTAPPVGFPSPQQPQYHPQPQYQPQPQPPMGGGGSAYGPGAPVPQYVPPSTPYAAPMQYTQYSVPNYAGPASVGTGHGPQQPQIEWTPTGHARIAGGRKKALLIGINYKGQQGELRGCHADVHNMKRFLTETYGFVESPQSMVVLLDDPQVHRGNAYLIPNKKSILSAMQWLVEGAQPGDSFFIHYSGHGGQQADKDGDEDDGSDETIYPLDHKSAGMITDDEMNAILVNKLPAGARLTAVFDSCHSGTALDLPFLYRPDGTLEKRAAKADRVKKSAMNAAKMAMTGGKMGLMRGAMDLFKQVSQPDQSPQDQARVTREKGSAGTVIMFSGCMDSQTSADAHIQGKATGAMSFALLKVLGSRGGMSYAQILAATREILKKDYSQIPQLSSANQIDINSVFLL